MWDYIESPYLIKWLVPWHSPIMWKYILAYHFKYHRSGETEVAPCLLDFPVQTHLFEQAPWDFSVILEELKSVFSLKAPRWVMVATPSQLPVRQGRERVRKGCPLQLSTLSSGHEMHLASPCSLPQLCSPAWPCSWTGTHPTETPVPAWSLCIPLPHPLKDFFNFSIIS